MNLELMMEYKELIYSGKISEAKDLLLGNIPEDMMVYKYFRGINRDWDTITKPAVWLCQTGKLNDPYDSAFLINCRSKEKYDCETEGDIAVKEGMEQLEQDKKSKKMQESVFITCFSEKCDSMLMWSHYSSEHKGICVGYKLPTLIEKYNCFPVIYSKEMPSLENFDVESDEKLYAGILTKNEDWAYECEWRIISVDKTMTGQNGKILVFEKPSAIFIGKRQEDTIAINHEKFKTVKSKDPNAVSVTTFKNDDFYLDINTIIDYGKIENIEISDFDLSRKNFELIRRIYKIQG